MSKEISIPDDLFERHQITLSLQQREAVEAPLGQLLLLAVPGAGKTTVLTARVAHLLCNLKADPRRILMLTYNRESARDLTDRWQNLFASLCPESPQFSTIHSFCFRLLRQYARWKGSRMPEVLENQQGGREQILSNLYRELAGEFAGEELLNRISSAISYTVNRRIKAEETQARFSIEKFAEIYRRYTVFKREREWMDFDDMLLFSVTALQRYPVLLKQIRESYDHILVDEAQDISGIQHQLLRLLAGNSVFLVGDEDQSIYGFRGAYPQGLMDFFQTFPEGRLMKLEENYRSTGNIVEAADRLIRSNTERYEKKMHTSRPQGKAVQICRDCSMEEEYDAIASLAEELSQQGSCAILYRSTYTGLGVARELKKRGVCYSASCSRLGYTGDFITRDVAALLRFALNPSDPTAFYRAYPLLGCGISREMAQNALEERHDSYLRWLVDQDQVMDKRTGKILYTDRMIQKMKGKSPSVQISIVIDQLGYLFALERRNSAPYFINSFVMRLTLLKQLAEDFTSVEEFLEWLPSAEQLLGKQDADAAIRLSTVHSAKGQEFDHVIIADALEGIFPAKDPVEYAILGDLSELEEETRLFYTAMTRARNTLTIFAPSKGLHHDLLESRFLSLIDHHPVMIEGHCLRTGMEVAHSFFGLGVVEEINPERKMFWVRFRHTGKKSFGFASLEQKNLFRLLE